MQAAKMPGLAKRSHGEYTKRVSTYGKGSPCHVISCIPGRNEPRSTGQRPRPMVGFIPKDDRGWRFAHASPKDVRGKPGLPSDRSGYREERDGLRKNRHLHDLVESITMNVGGPYVEGAVPDEAYGRRRPHSSRSA